MADFISKVTICKVFDIFIVLFSMLGKANNKLLICCCMKMNSIRECYFIKFVYFSLMFESGSS